MNGVIRKLLLLSIIFSSFSAWLALHDYVRLPMIFLGIAIVLALCSNPSTLLRKIPNTSVERLFLSIFLFIFACSFIVNSVINPTTKLMSNGVATILIIFTFYYILSSLFYSYLTKDDVLSALGTGGLVLMGIIFVDELLVNIFDIRLALFFRSGEILHSYFNWGAWIASSAPTEEPGYSAMSLNILAPFSILKYKKYRLLLCCTYIALLFGLCSSQGIASFGLCSIVTFLTLKHASKLKLKIIGYCFLFAFVIALFIGFDNIASFLDAMSFWSKVTMSGETLSDVSRFSAWQQAISDGNDAPFIGKGPGYGKYLINGYLSTFLGFYAMYGVIAAVAFIIFWLIIYRKCFKLEKNIRPYLIYTFTTTFIIGMVIDQLHMFIFWLLPSILVVLSNPTLLTKKNKYDS